MIKAEIISDPVGLNDWRTAWRELFGERPHEPSVSFEWTQALFRNHLGPEDRLLLVVLKDAHRICGFIPLVAESRRIFGLPLVTLYPLSERYNTHSDLLLARATAECVRCFLDAVMSLPLPWDVFSMRRLVEGGALTMCLENQAKDLRAPLRSTIGGPSFILPLPGTFEEYLAQRSGKFRNFLRRAEKRLAARGHVSFLRAGTDLDLDASYEALLGIEVRSWKHQHGTAISAIGRQRGFYEDLCHSLAVAGHLHLTFLALDGRPIAYNLGVVYGGTYSYLKTSFDEGVRQDSPASIARSRLLASLIPDGIQTFDFPGEPYEWEAQWTRELQWHRSLVMFNRTMRGRFCALAQHLRDCGRSAAKGRGFEYVDPHCLKPEPKDGGNRGAEESIRRGRDTIPRTLAEG
ncbi:MAG TPA: GNAT family N-acetyltransferase [Candidatus Methanoperedens sp.]|nr:GNAT family N-acetyltransferase [Candidatus Methanoperedens sp.]